MLIDFEDIGQPAEYMLDLRMKYAFLSTYEETVFLKQEHVNGRWEIHHTDVIYHSSHYIPPSSLVPEGVVSLRQCFFYIGTLALAGPGADNRLPSIQWVRQ